MIKDGLEDINMRSQIDFLCGWEAVQKHVSERERISFPVTNGGYSVPEKIALVHSELSEALEAHRKNLMDDHIPARAGLEIELADAVIRIMGIAQHHGYKLGGAILLKAAYNDERADHKDRSGPHGKRY